MNLLACAVLLLQATCSFGGRNFRLGHSRGGNLGGPGDYEGPLPKAQWFKQKLDHFSPTDLTMWKQRYYVNDSFYDFENPGPVFLMIGGEGVADPKWMVKGAWIDYAREFKALCFNLEHRFYGASQPKEDLSVKNLAYLTSHQALADLAYFISAMNDHYKFDSRVRWVAFGGSYPGALAAWLRLKYPQLVYAAVSTSGPLLAKVNFMEYYQVVVQALREKTGSEDCVTELTTAHKQIVALMQTKPALIETEFKVCKPFSQAKPIDIRNFYSSIANDFADLVQYNEDNRIGDGNEKFKNVTINTVCNILTEPDARPAFQRLGTFNSMMLEKYNQTCLDYSYDNMIQELRNITWTEDAGGRQWFYQTCTEFGYYQTSSAEVEAFGDQFSLDFYVQQCQDVFGQKFDVTYVTTAAAWTNVAYGGLDIDVTRVVFVQGSVDPWHKLGLTKTSDNDAPVIYIHGTAHCANMYPPRDEDLEELKRARVDIRQYLGAWLSMP